MTTSNRKGLNRKTGSDTGGAGEVGVQVGGDGGVGVGIGGGLTIDPTDGSLGVRVAPNVSVEVPGTGTDTSSNY